MPRQQKGMYLGYAERQWFTVSKSATNCRNVRCEYRQASCPRRNVWERLKRQWAKKNEQDERTDNVKAVSSSSSHKEKTTGERLWIMTRTYNMMSNI